MPLRSRLVIVAGMWSFIKSFYRDQRRSDQDPDLATVPHRIRLPLYRAHVALHCIPSSKLWRSVHCASILLDLSIHSLRSVFSHLCRC